MRIVSIEHMPVPAGYMLLTSNTGDETPLGIYVLCIECKWCISHSSIASSLNTKSLS